MQILWQWPMANTTPPHLADNRMLPMKVNKINVYDIIIQSRHVWRMA